MDPWTDHVELINAKPVHITSAREKMPFEITPFAPYLTRFSSTGTSCTAKIDEYKATRGTIGSVKHDMYY